MNPVNPDPNEPGFYPVNLAVSQADLEILERMDKLVPGTASKVINEVILNNDHNRRLSLNRAEVERDNQGLKRLRDGRLFTVRVLTMIIFGAIVIGGLVLIGVGKLDVLGFGGLLGSLGTFLLVMRIFAAYNVRPSEPPPPGK